MGQIIIPNAVERRPNYMYYIDGEGSICAAKMVRKGRTQREQRGLSLNQSD